MVTFIASKFLLFYPRKFGFKTILISERFAQLTRVRFGFWTGTRRPHRYVHGPPGGGHSGRCIDIWVDNVVAAVSNGSRRRAYTTATAVKPFDQHTSTGPRGAPVGPATTGGLSPRTARSGRRHVVELTRIILFRIHYTQTFLWIELSLFAFSIFCSNTWTYAKIRKRNRTIVRALSHSPFFHRKRIKVKKRITFNCV